MKLWLLRHGEAGPYQPKDAERQLTPQGIWEARQSAQHLCNQPINTVLVSPYARAQQTAQHLCSVLTYQGTVETVDWITPESSAEEALQHLEAYTSYEHILLVTHQPFVGELGGLLVHGNRQEALPLKTGSLAELEGAVLARGLMHLRSLRHP